VTLELPVRFRNRLSKSCVVDALRGMLIILNKLILTKYKNANYSDIYIKEPIVIYLRVKADNLVI